MKKYDIKKLAQTVAIILAVSLMVKDSFWTRNILAKTTEDVDMLEVIRLEAPNDVINFYLVTAVNLPLEYVSDSYLNLAYNEDNELVIQLRGIDADEGWDENFVVGQAWQDNPIFNSKGYRNTELVPLFQNSNLIWEGRWFSIKDGIEKTKKLTVIRDTVNKWAEMGYYNIGFPIITKENGNYIMKNHFYSNDFPRGETDNNGNIIIWDCNLVDEVIIPNVYLKGSPSVSLNAEYNGILPDTPTKSDFTVIARGWDRTGAYLGEWLNFQRVTDDYWGCPTDVVLDPKDYSIAVENDETARTRTVTVTQKYYKDPAVLIFDMPEPNEPEDPIEPKEPEEPNAPSIQVQIPKGYVHPVRNGATLEIADEDLSVTANGEAVSPEDYKATCKSDSDKKHGDLTVNVTYDGKDYSMDYPNARLAYDMSLYTFSGIPESITMNDRRDFESVHKALANVKLSNEYEVLPRQADAENGYFGNGSYAYQIWFHTTWALNGNTITVYASANNPYTFGTIGNKKTFEIPIVIKGEGKTEPPTEEEDEPSTEDNPDDHTDVDEEDTLVVTPPENPEPETPAPTPAIEEVEDNRITINAEALGYTAQVSMNSLVPYSKNKKTIARSLNVTCKVLDSEGNDTGIYVKSVKATKPKKGRTKATITLKGRTKIEKKVAKKMNKRLKKISVEVGS